MVLFSLLSRICINNFVFTFETNTFSNDFWAMWYIKTVYFSHEIKLVNADLIFKYLFFSWFVNYFCIFLKYFSYPHDSGKVLWIHVCQFISLSVHLPVCNPFFYGIARQTLLIFLHGDRYQWIQENSRDGFLKK